MKTETSNMKFLQKLQTFLLFMLLVGFYKVRSDVKVHAGNTTTLTCANEKGKDFVMSVWKVRRQNKPVCYVSFVEAINNKINDCNNHARLDIGPKTITLTLENITVSDEGNYTCEVVNENGTLASAITLKVIAQPSVSLDVNSDGSLECRAVGGFPAAEISWIPYPGNINTTKTKNVDDTWTVISTYKSDGGNVTCFVSHPTFVNPWSRSIEVTVSSGWGHLLPHSIVCVLYTVLIICIVFDLRKMKNEKVKHERRMTYQNVVA